MSDPAGGTPTVRERALEGELLAPCCWTQTLDIHDSEIARQLRHEIALRVARHESSESIRDDLVARYGSNLIAVPRGSPLPMIAPAMMLALALMAIIVVNKARGWRSANRSHEPASIDPERSAYDEVLDEALRKLGD